MNKYFLITIVIIGSITLSNHGINGEPINNRIINGIEVDIQSYPYMVSIRRMGNHICGGAIISNMWILTAAHCVIKTAPFQVTVRGGHSNRLQGVTIVVAEIIMHPEFNGLTLNNDVALLRLSLNITLNANMQPIPLGIQGTIATEGSTITIAGWGLIALEGEPSTTLRAVTLTVVNKATCNNSLAEFGGLATNDMCAGTGGPDKCLGDQGGPLVQGGRVIAVSSWQPSCGDSRWPGVYTHIAPITVRSFIRTITGL